MSAKYLISKESSWLAAFAFVFAVASTPAFADDDKPRDDSTEAKVEDPLEDLNRITSGFNRVVRGIIIDPLVDGYQAITPEPMQEAIGNAVSNFNEPATAVSSLLQGDTENAGQATKRFFINSTLGLGGLNDPATEMGYESRTEDLGQAAGAGGTEAGPHIVLPILGPSNSRDLVGDVLTSLATPVPLVAKVAAGGVEYSTNQDDINATTKGALDPYVVERDAYEQHRKFLINNGETPLLDGPTLEEK